MGKAKGAPEGNISGSIRCCMDTIASCTYSVHSTIRQSISNALTNYSPSTRCIDYALGGSPLLYQQWGLEPFLPLHSTVLVRECQIRPYH